MIVGHGKNWRGPYRWELVGHHEILIFDSVFLSLFDGACGRLHLASLVVEVRVRSMEETGLDHSVQVKSVRIILRLVFESHVDHGPLVHDARLGLAGINSDFDDARRVRGIA